MQKINSLPPRSGKTAKLEQVIQKDMLNFLEKNGILAIKHNNIGIYARAGVPDILCCSNQGKFIGIEVKRPGEKPKPIQQAFIDAINKLNVIIADDVELSRCFKEHSDNIKNGLIPIFLPYNNRYLNALCKRGVLPSFISKSKKLRIANYLNCESHLDCLREIVSKL